MSWYPIGENGRCVSRNSAGVAFETFSCLYEDSFVGRTVTRCVRNERKNNELVCCSYLKYKYFLSLRKFCHIYIYIHVFYFNSSYYNIPITKYN